MSAASRRHIVATTKLDVRECMKTWKNLRDKYVCLQKNNKNKQKLTIAKSEGVRREKEMSQHFSLSAYETSVHDHTI